MTEPGGVPQGTEVGHGGPYVAERVVERRLFLAIGAFVAGMAILYWFTAYEDAGTAMLAITAVMALWFGTYLWLRQRAAGEPATTAEGSPADHTYLPDASIWPLVIAAGAATVANGLVLGIWIIVPGIVALVLGVGGFVRQSRRRD